MQTLYEIQRIKQIIKEDKSGRQRINSPEDGAEIARHFIGDDDREVFFVMCLNVKNQVVAVHRAHVGSLNASVVRPARCIQGSYFEQCGFHYCLSSAPFRKQRAVPGRHCSDKEIG